MIITWGGEIRSVGHHVKSGKGIDFIGIIGIEYRISDLRDQELCDDFLRAIHGLPAPFKTYISDLLQRPFLTLFFRLDRTPNDLSIMRRLFFQCQQCEFRANS